MFGNLFNGLDMSQLDSMLAKHLKEKNAKTIVVRLKEDDKAEIKYYAMDFDEFVKDMNGQVQAFQRDFALIKKDAEEKITVLENEKRELLSLIETMKTRFDLEVSHIHKSNQDGNN